MPSLGKEPMLSAPFSHTDEENIQFWGSTSRNKSASFSIDMNSFNFYGDRSSVVGQGSSLDNEGSNQYSPLFVAQGPIERKRSHLRVGRYPPFNGINQNDWPGNNYTEKNEHLLKSGQLGVCSDPYCTSCPTFHSKGQVKRSKASVIFDHKIHNVLHGDAKSWAKRISSFLLDNMPGVMNPHAKLVQNWHKFFVFSCLAAVFLDPLFFFILYVQQANNCVTMNWPMTKAMVILRSITDLIFLVNMLIQFRLAYVAPESTVVGAGELVDHPKKTALNYLSGYFLIDLFVILPLPQIIILLIVPRSTISYEANYAKSLLETAILVQYAPKLSRILPLLAGQTPSGILFESAFANFVIHAFFFFLAGHVVAACWYLFGLQRINDCLREACYISGIQNCLNFLDCGYGNRIVDFQSDPNWNNWQNSPNASACYGTGGSFNFGIYANGLSVMAGSNVIQAYIASLFWGFQQVSVFAGNQVPSYYVWEVLFNIGVIQLSLILFVLLIGNIQIFLLSLGRRKLEMYLRRSDFESWMHHRRLPEELRRQVRESERYGFAATRGINEEMLLEDLPEDLQTDIRRHLFKFIKNVRIFSLLDEPILDAISERLKQSIYIEGSNVLYRGGIIDKMVFIVRGKMESIGEDGIVVPLSEGGICGEELLTWCLERYSVNKGGTDMCRIKILGHRLLSNRLVRCLTNVEAFILREADLEDVISLFARYLRSPRVQGAIRYASPYWRCLAAIRIQVAWRYRKKRLSRPNSFAFK